MNQNMNQNNAQFTNENLAQTQVLNLNDVEEAAKYEKKMSKRPAIMLACAGMFAIIMGIAYPFIMTAIEGEDIQQPATNQKRTTEEGITKPVMEEILVCTLTIPVNQDGTSTIFNKTLTFYQNKLQSYTKTFEVNAIPGNQLGATTVEAYRTGYKALEMNLPGYFILSQQTQTGGVLATATIDLKTFDKTTLPESQKSNILTNVEYDLNTDKNALVTTLTSAGYTCK